MTAASYEGPKNHTLTLSEPNLGLNLHVLSAVYFGLQLECYFERSLVES